MKAITKEWLDYAKADLKCCEKIIEDPSLTNIVAFHSQQAVEKCFKGIFEENELAFQRIHSLYKLYMTIKDYINFDVDVEKLELLDEIYTSSRYPAETGLMPHGKPGKEDTIEMYNFAKHIYSKTIELIGN